MVLEQGQFWQGCTFFWSRENLTEIVAYKLLKQNSFFPYSVNTSDFASLVLIVSVKSYGADQIFHMPIPQSL